MKLAWFRADTSPPASPFDDCGALIAQLRSTHEIEGYTAANAHARTGAMETQEVQQDRAVLPVQQKVRGTPVTFGAIPADRLDVVRQAMARARQAGASAELIADASPERLLQVADVVVSLPWPSCGEPPAPALAAMAAGKPVIVLEAAAVADWPALDPQTWRPRGFTSDEPIVVSIDPRDEEHSLVLAIRRLSTDATLRAQLGDAARDWWRTHAGQSKRRPTIVS